MTVEQTFNQYHQDNPHVFDLFEQFARNLMKAGHTKLSSKMIINRIRWEAAVTTTTGGDGYLINDRYTPWYARLFMSLYPQHEGVFETRTIRTP